MRSIKMSQIEDNIKLKQKKVNADIQTNKGNQPRIRRDRPRSMDERIALTKRVGAGIIRK